MAVVDEPLALHEVHAEAALQDEYGAQSIGAFRWHKVIGCPCAWQIVSISTIGSRSYKSACNHVCIRTSLSDE